MWSSVLTRRQPDVTAGKKKIIAMNAPYEDGKGAGDSKEEHI